MTNLKYFIKYIVCTIVFYLLTLTTYASDVETECVSGKAGPLATIALLSKKPSISDADFYAYWRDIHGMLATRIPGFWTYRQYHLGEELTDFRRIPSGYKKNIESMQGFADVSFCNEQAMVALAASPQSELIFQDEKNIFSNTYLYGVLAGGSLTLKSQMSLAESSANNNLIMLLAKAADENFNEFRIHLDTTLQRLLTSCSALQRLRVNYFQTYDASAWPAPEVNHQPQQVFNAAIEFQFADDKAVVDCLAGHLVFGESKDQPVQRFQQAYAVNQRYAMVVDGRISPIGLRGLPAIELINRVGAKNQVSDAVLKAVYGGSVR